MMVNEKSWRFRKTKCPRCRWPALAAVLLASCTTPGSSGSAAPDGSRSRSTSTSPAMAAGLNVRVEPALVPDGGVALLSLELPPDLAIDPKNPPTGEFEGVAFPFFPRKGSPGVWHALVGVPHAHAPGEAQASVRVAGEQGRVTFQIVDGQYLSEVLKVQERKVNPRPSDLKRIQKEGAAIRAAYQTVTSEQLWEEGMKFPIDSPMTSSYGTKRVYNGQLNGFHSGLDLRAPIGTPIRAAAGGIVRLSQNLFFTGNTVILDHGYGLMTLYAHMSRRKVKVGQRVRAGTLLGISGQTGRVNGPHLHWMTIVHSTKVNPLEVMKVLR